MMKPAAFTSAIFRENTKRAPEHTKKEPTMHSERSLYAIAHYLEQVIPKGGVVCVIHPKSILQNILPKLAQRKRCEIITYKQGVEADLYLTEPEGFSRNGAIVLPEEAKLIKQFETTAVGSIAQWTDKPNSKHDCVRTARTVTEIGVYKHEHFVYELKNM